MSVQREMEEPIYFGDPAATSGVSVFDQDFDMLFSYDGDDLGLAYTPACSAFCLWAPTAQEAEVVLYDSWQQTAGRRLPMTREVRGTWRLTVSGDLEGKLYTYRVRIGE
ncbi:type I pullulanase, partial [Paenibacillus graminis]